MLLKIANVGKHNLIIHFSLLCLRVSVGLFMLSHGLPKLNTLFASGSIEFADPFGWGATFTLILVVFAEFLCSVLIILGLFTRLASIPLIINMLVVVFIVHGADPFAVKEKAYLYGLCYWFLLVFGSGKFSIDGLIAKN
jgi:putative oxidoreductase